MFYAHNIRLERTQVPLAMSMKAYDKASSSPRLPVMIPKEWSNVPFETIIGSFDWDEFHNFLKYAKDEEVEYKQGNIFCEVFYSGALNYEKTNIFRFPLNTLYEAAGKVYFKGSEWTESRGVLTATTKELFEVTEYLENSWYTSCYVGLIIFERTGSILRISFRKSTLVNDMYNALQRLAVSGFVVQTNVPTLKNPMYIHDVRFVSL